MSRYVALLRAINVGGHNVSMAELRGHFEALGLDDVETFIASGNVIFSAPARHVGSVQKRIEDRLRAELGYDVTTFLRTDAELAAVAAHQPFTTAQLKAALRHNVGFLAEPLDRAGTKAVMALGTTIETFHVHGREVYWLSKVGQSDSKFSNAVFERTLNVRATWRGLNTVVKLAAKYPPRRA